MLDFRTYLHSAESFANRAAQDHDEFSRKPLIVVATLFAWLSIEAYVNGILMDFASVAGHFELHEKALLQEKKLVFVDTGSEIGKFELRGDDYRKTEHKIMFLITKFGGGMLGSGLDKGQTFWQKFVSFRNARNSIAHPRPSDPEISISEANEYIRIARRIIQILGREIRDEDVAF